MTTFDPDRFGPLARRITRPVEIGGVQVGGGDRCEMGDLDKFSSVRGECLARVRVMASDVVRFDK